MKRTLTILTMLLALAACREPEETLPSTQTGVGSGEAGEITGFFLLNEGNMGSNKCTLDYYDYATGIYVKNIYAERNPGVVQELGDVGNDLQIYGARLYAVVNCSNLVEVMDVATARHIGSVSIPNCRYITFKDQYAYVSSYAGPVEIDPNSRRGYVAKVDTTTLQVVDSCTVGYQPEEMVIVGNKLYVANSGGYRVPDYDHTVSVIDLTSFKEIKTIDVAPNLHRLELDAYGYLWVSSRGDYYDIQPMVFVINTEADFVMEQLDLLACSDMTLCGDSLYVYSNAWNYFTQTSDVNYAIVDVKTRQVLTRHFITDGTDMQFQNPYGIAVNPNTHEIFVTDARDYITPGKVYCYSPEGRLKWSANTGDIPSRIVFTHTPLLR
ncbi:MAG: YncE family protein [Bacteroidales bacterium]|nr:YncE family protein [Bacteroidales bacterium]